MKKTCIYVNPFFIRDGVFDASDSFLNRDNQLEPYRMLKFMLAEKGFNLRTQDFHPPEESEFTIYIDMPKHLPPRRLAHKSVLVLLETELIRPDNWRLRSHNRFAKILTWSEHHLKSSRYAKINFPQPIPAVRPRVSFEDRQKLCCLIAGGKLSLHPQQLYSERIRWIRWFEKNRPNDFDFFGAGWEKLWMTGPIWIRAINKLPLWRSLLFKDFPSYKGRIESKLETLSKYRFSICLENARGFNGYITEKIFDCFFAGNIPLYLGAPDITEKIPENCFIDLRKFNSLESAYSFISNMSAEQFNQYLKDIDSYLESDAFKPFTSKVFAETIISHCMDL